MMEDGPGAAGKEDGEVEDGEEGELPAQRGGAVGPGAAPQPVPHVVQAVVVRPRLPQIQPLDPLHLRYDQMQCRQQEMPARMVDLWQHLQGLRPHLEDLEGLALDRFQVLRSTRPHLSH